MAAANKVEQDYNLGQIQFEPKAITGIETFLAVEKALLSEEWDLLSALIPAEKLGVWVPNEPDDLSFWLRQPIRQITTDRPDLAVRVREGLFDAAH